MPRATTVQITRNRRKDGSVTFALRVRVAGSDDRVSLGNSSNGWDEARVEQARKQLLAKIDLGLWTPGRNDRQADDETEPTIQELATDWLEARKRNPAIRPRTTELNESQLKRYLLPFFGELRASEITPAKLKAYRDQIHVENAQIRAAADAGRPLRAARTRQPLRTLGNDAINKTLRTLALIIDEAEDAGWVDRNVARGRRTREPVGRRRARGVLDVDEFLSLIEAADQLDNAHRPRTLERAAEVRFLRDEAGLEWNCIAKQIGVTPTTAIYLYDCHPDDPSCGPRRAIIATLGLAGPRVGELCALDRKDIDLAKGHFHIEDSKTDAGIRTVDIHPALLDHLSAYEASRPVEELDSPAFPTRTGNRRDRRNVLGRVIVPAVNRANQLRAERHQLPIRAHVSPHTFRRSYITFMIAAGYDLPYVQAQVGHVDPSTTLSLYAQVMRRADRDQLRAEIRRLLGADSKSTQAVANSAAPQAGIPRLRALREAAQGRTLRR